jgi:hypothetical protein
MCCGRCRSTDIDRAPNIDADAPARCRECGVRLQPRAAAWLPTLLVAAAVLAAPTSPWLLIAALPALLAAIAWGESLRPIGEPSAPPAVPGARLL